MIRAEPSLDRDGKDVWYGQYCTGRFWHTVRRENGRAAEFNSEQEARVAARQEWWEHTRPAARTTRSHRRGRPARRARDDIEAEHSAVRYAG